MRDLDALVYGIISERRTTGPETNNSSNDLLSMLLALRDEETGEAMTDRELRDQVITFIGAGHETTAVALAWTWYLISQYPDVEARMRAEVAGVLGGRVPTVADLPQLVVTRNVIQESLRLYPPVFGVVRDVIDEDEIGGFRIPAKTSVILSQYVTHHHPAVWENPERFDPDRFTPEKSEGRARFAHFPFLGGPHHCIGAEFAMMEATLIVAMVMQRYRLRLAPGTRVEPLPMLSLRPKGGLPMLLEQA
jgi:cytochrome P450